MESLQSLFAAANYPLVGTVDHNHFLPTALGAVRPTCLAPESFVAGELRYPDEVVLADLPGFRDFYAAFAAANMSAAGKTARSLPLPLPRAPARRDLYATDLARLIDTIAYRGGLGRCLAAGAGRRKPAWAACYSGPGRAGRSLARSE